MLLVTNLFNEEINKEETDHDEQEYPDEVLKSEWNPVLVEVHSRIIAEKESEEYSSESGEK